MADIYLTESQLNTLFWQITMAALGFDYTQYDDPNNPPSSMPVKKSWQQNGAPAWKITDNVTFVRVLLVDDDYNRIRDVKTTKIDDTNLNQATSYTRVLEVTWIFYGPNAGDNAQAVRDKMFYDTVADMLDAQNLYLVTDIAEPKRIPELFNGQWWDRYDLSMRFNEEITRNITIQSVGSVTVNISNGDSNTAVNIND